MNIRCVCGNETTITPAYPDYILKDESWFDPKTEKLRCSKRNCASEQLPLELVDATGPIKVRVVAGRTIAQKGFWS